MNQDIQFVAQDEKERKLLHDLHNCVGGNKNYESAVSVFKNLIGYFAKGKDKEYHLKTVHIFEDDIKKHGGFFILKNEFLTAYSCLDETEYDVTAFKSQ